MIYEEKKLLINSNQSVHGVGVAVLVGVGVLVGVALPVEVGVTVGFAVGFGVTFLVGVGETVLSAVGTAIGVGVEKIIFIAPSSGTGEMMVLRATSAPTNTITNTTTPTMMVMAASVLLRSSIR